MRGKILLLAAALTFGTGFARVNHPRGGRFLNGRLGLALGTVGSVSATPGSISFQAANPSSAIVSGSAPGTLGWLVLSGSHLQNWTLSVQAASSTFVGCPTVPVAAVQANCTAASVSGGGGIGSCSGPFPLSTTPQQMAGGTEGDGTNSYSVSINFTLAESWRYVANPSCMLTLTYFVNAP